MLISLMLTNFSLAASLAPAPSLMSSLTTLANISHVSPRVIRVLGCNPGMMTLQGTNTYLIGTGRERVLLDTGEPTVPEYVSLLRGVLLDSQITISHILCTHWHADHTGGVADILRMLREIRVTKFPEIWKYPAPEHDESLIDMLRNISDSFLNHKKKQDVKNDSFADIPLNYFKDHQEFVIEGSTIRVYHTPGHTTDHVALWLKEEGALFSGDCVLGEGTAVFEDLYTYMKSLELIVHLNPGRIYPGHGPVIDQDPVGRVQGYIRHRNQREAQILAALKSINQTAPAKWVTPIDIVRVVYKEVDRKLWPAAAVNVEQHLDKLVKDGLVEKKEVEGVEYRLTIKSGKL